MCSQTSGGMINTTSLWAIRDTAARILNLQMAGKDKLQALGAGRPAVEVLRKGAASAAGQHTRMR